MELNGVMVVSRNQDMVLSMSNQQSEEDIIKELLYRQYKSGQPQNIPQSETFTKSVEPTREQIETQPVIEEPIKKPLLARDMNLDSFFTRMFQDIKVLTLLVDLYAILIVTNFFYHSLEINYILTLLSIVVLMIQLFSRRKSEKKEKEEKKSSKIQYKDIKTGETI